MVDYITDKSFKPNLKKCKECGNYGMPNRTCKYWYNNLFTEWGCSNPKAIKQKNDDFKKKLLKKGMCD